MIIDVKDLKIKKLTFSRDYDNRRLNRGETIYRNREVTIKEVEKLGENEIKVEATVEGSHSFTFYDTYLDIVDNDVVDCKCTCMDYNNGYTCKHIIATALEVIDSHAASTQEGKEREKREVEERRRKLREERKEQERREKQQYEYNRKYKGSLNLLYKFENNANNIFENNLDIPEIFYETKEKKKAKTSELATSIKINCIVEPFVDSRLKLTFKIGQNRMYNLKNISELYKAYKNNTELYIGKQLSFIPKRENFDEDSQKLFDFIIKYGEMIKHYSQNNMYGYDNKSISIQNEEIDDFFNMMQNEKIIMHIYGGIEEYAFSNENLNIYAIFKKEEVEIYDEWSWNWEDNIEKSEEYVLKLNDDGYFFINTGKNIYILYKNKIYTIPSDESLKNLIDLFQYQDKIIIPEDKIEDFRKYVFPKLRYITDETISSQKGKESIIANELASKILLDTDDNGNILLTLKFCYDNYEFNILDPKYADYMKKANVVRNVPAEKQVLERIFMDGFELVENKKEFIMKNLDDTYEFLSNKIEGYMNDFEVLATDKFKNKQIKRPKISSMGIKIDNGLLELDFSKINIDIKELKDVLKDYNIKKKYHKLKNGDILDLTNNKDIELLDEMSTTLDIDYSKLEKGVVELPINRSFYLEKIVEENKDINVTKNEEFLQIVDSVENTENEDEIELDSEFENKLRDYQKVGYRWLKTLEKYKFGGILADDMGLGKTIQIIALLKSSQKQDEKNTSIVVCPSTLVLNWKSEIEKWCNSMKVLIIRGKAEERASEIENYKDYDLVITSYDLLKRDIDNYENKYFKYIIADEAQYIKNSSTQNATSLKHLKGETKFALTGTPIENSVAELWSIFDFIMPGYLYNYNKFKKKFEEPILKYNDVEALNRLKKIIAPFVLRRVKKDVLSELPDKNITIMKNEMEEEQQKIYMSYLMQTRKEIAEELEGSTFEKSKFKILMLLTRLRQICCHPGLFIENYKGGSGKLKQCIDLVCDAIEAKHKILLFSSYTSMFEIIEKELKKRDIKYYKLIGSTPVNDRIKMVEDFNKDDNIKVFLISLKAGGTGLNLTSADVVIHYDPWWNVSSENQATDRAYRIGQKNSVQVYKLITSNSIEEKINKMQERKEKLSKDILSTKEMFINKMSKDEIMDLFA